MRNCKSLETQEMQTSGAKTSVDQYILSAMIITLQRTGRLGSFGYGMNTSVG
jgi:hypothetical protein